MNITIDDHKKIRDIQEEFHNKFPYLRIEFYSRSHDEMENSPKEYTIDPEKTLGAVRKKHINGEISINGHIKVANLERQFQESYGLNVQVFRRSGELWLQTGKTDQWTLADQNRHGMESVTM